ncbi:hypothetical protein TRFO_28720 [Tritrichomonas foetus]|uniref:CLASP N-terminal domain-containing protein n=1 Tax=Tritrichomonas foetus TaxID=1144522 RepID=A0A1J4JZL8_9EUKA|nr:hypothetical protein TRFO_28720 [Tritrichomonas foetus]|eukprot:OHT03936.1 hypothetical protein TRFO_28720 [Tritrichomonas foetus]
MSGNSNRPFTAPKVSFPSQFPKSHRNNTPSDQCKQLIYKLCEQSITATDFFSQLLSIRLTTREIALSVFNCLLFYVLHGKPYHPQFGNQFTAIFSKLIQNSNEPVRRSTVSLISLIINNSSILKSLSCEFNSWNEEAQEIFLSFAFTFHPPEVLEWKTFLNNAKVILNTNNESLSCTASDFIEFMNFFSGKNNDPKIRNSMELSQEQMRRSMNMRNSIQKYKEYQQQTQNHHHDNNNYEMESEKGNKKLEFSNLSDLKSSLSSPPKNPNQDKNKIESLSSIRNQKSSTHESKQKEKSSEIENDSHLGKSPIFEILEADQSNSGGRKSSSKSVNRKSTKSSQKSIRQSKSLSKNSNIQDNLNDTLNETSNFDEIRKSKNPKGNPKLLDSVNISNITNQNKSNQSYNPNKNSRIHSIKGMDQFNDLVIDVDEDIDVDDSDQNNDEIFSSGDEDSLFENVNLEPASIIETSKPGYSPPQIQKSDPPKENNKLRQSTRSNSSSRNSQVKLADSAQTMKASASSSSSKQRQSSSKPDKSSQENTSSQSLKSSVNINSSPPKAFEDSSNDRQSIKHNTKSSNADTMKVSKSAHAKSKQNDAQTMKPIRKKSSTVSRESNNNHKNIKESINDSSISFASTNRPGTARRNKKNESSVDSNSQFGGTQDVLMTTTEEFIPYVPLEEEEDDDDDYSDDLFGGAPEEVVNKVTFSGPPLPNINYEENITYPHKNLPKSNDHDPKKVVSNSYGDTNSKKSSNNSNVQTIKPKKPSKSVAVDQFATTAVTGKGESNKNSSKIPAAKGCSASNSPSKHRQFDEDANPYDYIIDMTNSDWEKQQRSVEGLRCVLNTKPTALASHCREIWMNLLDIIVSPRTMLSNSALALTLELFTQFHSQLIPQTPPFISICFNLCCNSRQFIADGAEKVLILISHKAPRNKVLSHFIIGTKHKNTIARGKAAQCILNLINQGGELEDSELKSLISGLTPLIRDNSEETRDSAKNALKKIVYDIRFQEIARDVCTNSQDYNELMKFIEF